MKKDFNPDDYTYEEFEKKINNFEMKDLKIPEDADELEASMLKTMAPLFARKKYYLKDDEMPTTDSKFEAYYLRRNDKAFELYTKLIAGFFGIVKDFDKEAMVEISPEKLHGMALEVEIHTISLMIDFGKEMEVFRKVVEYSEYFNVQPLTTGGIGINFRFPNVWHVIK